MILLWEVDAGGRDGGWGVGQGIWWLMGDELRILTPDGCRVSHVFNSCMLCSYHTFTLRSTPTLMTAMENHHGTRCLRPITYAWPYASLSSEVAGS